MSDRLEELRGLLNSTQQWNLALTAAKRKWEACEEEYKKTSQAYADALEQVHKLERKSVRSVVYLVTGTLDERQTRAAELCAKAKSDNDAAKQADETAQREMQRYKSQLERLPAYKREYQELLLQQAMQHDDGTLAALKQKTDGLKKEISNTESLLSLGRQAQSCAQDALRELQKAHGLGTADLFLGNDLLLSAAKHNHMDKAKEEVDRLQQLLQQLTPYSAVQEQQVTVTGFTRTADWLFDSLLVDWMIQDRIDESMEKVRYLGQTLNTLVEKQQTLLKSLLGQLRAVQQEMEQRIGKQP